MKKDRQRLGVQIWAVTIANPSLKGHAASSQPRHIILENISTLLSFNTSLFIKYTASLFCSKWPSLKRSKSQCCAVDNHYLVTPISVHLPSSCSHSHPKILQPCHRQRRLRKTGLRTSQSA